MFNKSMKVKQIYIYVFKPEILSLLFIGGMEINKTGKVQLSISKITAWPKEDCEMKSFLM